MPYNPKSLKNLQHCTFNKMTDEQLKEVCRQGGIASGKAKREKKLLKETLEEILTKPTKQRKIKNELKEQGLELDKQTSSMLSLVTKAEKGDVNAIKLIAQLKGELVEKTENDTRLSVEDYFKDNKLDV